MYTSDLDRTYWQAQLYEWTPRILGALAILIIAYALAKGTKWAFARMVDKVPALQRHNETEPGKTVGGLVGDIAFWLILLVGIMLALQPLGLSQVLEPVRQLTTNTFAYVPNLIGAGLVFFIGLVIAKIVRRIVESALLAANADRWLRNTGLLETGGMAAGTGTTADKVSLSRSLGSLAFYLVMIPITIMALDTLRIHAISEPATEMLTRIGVALPQIVGALILLGIGYIIGRLAKQFLEQLLPAAGFDRAVSTLGFTAESTTPSRTVGTIAMIAILIFAAIMAAEQLDSAIIATMLAQVLELGSRVLFGTGIILGGVVIARIVSKLVSGAGSENWLPAILKWSIIALAVAMGLSFMGLANEIVIIAFASIIGSAAVACALAFGLGGRVTAHHMLEKWRSDGLPKPPAKPKKPMPPEPPMPPSQPPLV